MCVCFLFKVFGTLKNKSTALEREKGLYLFSDLMLKYPYFCEYVFYPDTEKGIPSNTSLMREKDKTNKQPIAHLFFRVNLN
jgi:hypothetical protein